MKLINQFDIATQKPYERNEWKCCSGIWLDFYCFHRSNLNVRFEKVSKIKKSKKIKVTVFLYRFRLHASSLPYMYVFAFYSFNVIDKPNFCFIQKITNKVIEIALNTDWIWRQVNGFLDSRFYSIYVLIVENQHSNIHTEERRERERKRSHIDPQKVSPFHFLVLLLESGRHLWIVSKSNSVIQL